MIYAIYSLALHQMSLSVAGLRSVAPVPQKTSEDRKPRFREVSSQTGLGQVALCEEFDMLWCMKHKHVSHVIDDMSIPVTNAKRFAIVNTRWSSNISWIIGMFPEQTSPVP